MLLVLRNQCGMQWKPMDLATNPMYHRHVMLFFGGDRNEIDEVSKPAVGLVSGNLAYQVSLTNSG